MKWEIYADGASKGNPGPASYGYVILKSGEIIFEGNGTLGKKTNNEAEYTSLIEALKKLHHIETMLPSSNITIYMDSLLVISQLKGIYRVKALHLKDLYNEVIALTKGSSITWCHIPRIKNKHADALANKAFTN